MGPSERRGASVAPSAAPAVEARGISKSFDGVLANDAVEFAVRPGEIHAVLGENGAGKTTLVSIMAGLLQHDAGTLLVGGEHVRFRSPHDALRRGIGMVTQHPTLVPNLTVAENLALGRESSWNLRLRPGAIERWAADLCADYGTTLDVRTRVGRLTIDQVQEVEILRLLGADARILILDEPTAVLALSHVEQLFGALRRLRERGCAIVIVTHKLKETMALADRATVMRHGRVVRVLERHAFDEDVLAEAVVGRSLKDFVKAEEHADEARGADRIGRPRSPKVLEVEGLSVSGEGGASAVDGVSLELRTGEILGIAGVEGNGQRELIEALSGVRPISGGGVRLKGTPIHAITPRQLDRMGIGVVSGDRLRWDLVPELSVAENLMLSELVDRRSGFAEWGFVARRRVREEAEARIDRFDVRPAEPNRIAGELSGGNQQRVVLARELTREPALVLAAYPTRGLDIAAVSFVHQTLRELRRKGTAVLLVSADQDELFALSDRVAVIYRGRFSYESDVSSLDRRRFARAMVGLTGAGASKSTEVSA